MLRLLAIVNLLLCAALAFTQGIEITGGDKDVFKPQAAPSAIKPGTFSNAMFEIKLQAEKNGAFTVIGLVKLNGASRYVKGTMTKAGVVRATYRTGKEGTREAPINGNYRSVDDTIVITSLDGKPVHQVLTRGGKPLIKVGPYHGWTKDDEGAWEATVTRANDKDYTLTGTLSRGGGTIAFSGTLRGATGKVAGRMHRDNVDILVNGQYDFKAQQLNLYYTLGHGSFAEIHATLKPGPLPVQQLFGLVSKERGNVPGPGENNNVKIWGDQQEQNFRLDMEMKPPYEGKAHINFAYSSTLTATLKPGQIVELTVMGTADKSGRDAPGLAGQGVWLVEGDGAEVLETSKAFVGTASDGKFYASTTGVTKFRVLGKGTIKITAAYGGQYWGPSGSFNWNPVTYTYKFKEPATAKVGN